MEKVISNDGTPIAYYRGGPGSPSCRGSNISQWTLHPSYS